MDVVRTILDHQLVDRRKKKFGRVDGIVLEVSEGQPPRLAYLEMGWAPLARRIHARLGRWVEARLKKNKPDRPVTFRIPWSQVKAIDIDISVDLDAEKTPELAWECLVREKIFNHVSGGRK
jgi:sporulation protein YlmC with PRC-barrel domain